MEDIRLVMDTDSYDYTSKDGVRKTGVTLHNYGLYQFNLDGKSGQAHFIDFSKDLSLLDLFPVRPGLYKIQYNMVPGRNGSPSYTVSRAELLQPVNILDCIKDEFKKGLVKEVPKAL